MQDHSPIEIQRAREESRHYQREATRFDRIAREAEHKLRLKTIELQYTSTLLWLVCGCGIANEFIDSMEAGVILNAATIAAGITSAIIAHRAKKRACKEFGHAA